MSLRALNNSMGGMSVLDYCIWKNEYTLFHM
jgi:hypothetical protein